MGMGPKQSQSATQTTTTTQSFVDSFNKSMAVTDTLENLGNVYFNTPAPAADGGASSGVNLQTLLPYVALGAVAAGLIVVSTKKG